MAKQQKVAASATEASKQTAIAPISANPATVAAGFRVKRNVILPTLSPQVNQPLILRIDDEIRTSTYVDPDPKKAKEKPADICSVTDMQTGVQSILLVPAVMKSAFDRDYSDGSYVGKVFGVQKLPKRPGKRYFDVQLVELEADE